MTAYIYTDASYFPQHKIGSFAFWIECGSKTIQLSGVLLNTKNSTEAETMCIANALHTVLEEDFKRIKNITITTDSLQSILKIKSKSRLVLLIELLTIY